MGILQIPATKLLERTHNVGLLSVWDVLKTLALALAVRAGYPSCHCLTNSGRDILFVLHQLGLHDGSLPTFRPPRAFSGASGSIARAAHRFFIVRQLHGDGHHSLDTHFAWTGYT